METGKRALGASSPITSPRTLRNVLDSALERGSNMSINLPDSTIGVNLDARGDWTISVGLSLKSGRFNSVASGLEGIGFFHATETEGTSYFLWTTFLTQTENHRTITEEVLAQTLRILQGTPASQYIG